MSDRDKRGRFAPGNRAAAGRGPNRKRRELAVALRERMTPERLRGIVDRLLDAAESGDIDAAKLVLAYGVGTPRPEDPEPVVLDLPRIDAEDLGQQAILHVVRQLAAGELAPAEAAQVVSVIDAALLPELERQAQATVDALRAERERPEHRDQERVREALELRRALLAAVPHGLNEQSANTYLNEQRAQQLRKVAEEFGRWHDKRNGRVRHGSEAQVEVERPRTKPVRRESADDVE